MLAMAFEAATCLTLSYTAQAYMRDLQLDLDSQLVGSKFPGPTQALLHTP